MILNPYRFSAGAVDPVSNPLHWWDLDSLTTGLEDKGTGAWADLTNSGCVVSSGTGANSQDVIEWNSIGDYLHMTTDQAWDGSSTDEVSVSFWVEDSRASAGNPTLFSWRKQTTDRFIYIDKFNSSPDYARPIIFDASDSLLITGDADGDIDAVGWHHIVMTYDGTTNSVYVDGTLADADSGSLGTFDTNALPFSIGTISWDKGATGTTAYTGKMANFGIYDYPLSTDDVSFLYNSGTGRAYADL
jgi:hypothetical protein